ncbi:MAG: DUF4097 family beta strand repeat-containing protein [Clostridia bacterium]|jgi:DUF4097 and DUF4098 domain-containing protein YvlB
MNKGMKITAIIAASLIITGTAIFVVSGGIGNFKELFNEEPIQRIYNAKATVSEITVDVVNAKIVVIPSNVDKVKITYDESYDKQYQLSVDDNVLKMDEDNSKYFFDFHWLFNIFNFDETLTIEVPKDGKLSAGSIVTVNGTVNIKGFDVKTLNVRTVNGKITVEKIKTSDLNLNTVNGGIDFTEVNASAIKAETVNGSILGANPIFKSVNLKTVNGSMSMTEVDGVPSDYNIKFNSVNGRLFVNDTDTAKDYNSGNSKDKSIIAESVNGRLTLNFK